MGGLQAYLGIFHPHRVKERSHNMGMCRKEAEGSAAGALSVEALAESVEGWLPEAVGAGEEAGLPEAIAAELRPGALAEYERAQAAVFLAGAEVRGWLAPPHRFCVKEWESCREVRVLELGSTIHTYTSFGRCG